MNENKLPPIHPGEVLQAEFLEPLGISQYRLAHQIGVPPRRVNEIVHQQRRISANTALRLARFSVQANGSGSTYKWLTTSKSSESALATVSSRKCNRYVSNHACYKESNVQR